MERKGPQEEAERVNNSPTSAEWPESSRNRPLLSAHEQPTPRMSSSPASLPERHWVSKECGDEWHCKSPHTGAMFAHEQPMQTPQHRSMSCDDMAAVSGLAARLGRRGESPPAQRRAAAPGILNEAKTNCAVAARTVGSYWMGRKNRSVSCDELLHNQTALREDEEMSEFIPRQKSSEGERPSHGLLRTLMREKANAAAAVAARAAAKASVANAALAARAAAKASVVSELQPLLQPRLSESGISWDEALPTLDKLSADLLTTALKTGNLQPLLAKLKAASYQKPKAMQHRAAPIQQQVTQHSAALNRERRAAPKQNSETNEKLAQRAIPKPYPVWRACEDEQQRSAAKASVLASLKPILQPRLGEYDVSWDEAAPVLDRLAIGLLSTALADANVQPVLAKLRAAAYLSPPLQKLGSSDDLRKKLTATSCSLETALGPGPPPVAV
jgi:hypothetical protein